MENLKAILEKHHEHAKAVAKEILRELKKSSNNYGELKVNLSRFKQDTMFELGASQKYGSLFCITTDMLEKEMNDLPLTNRSKCYVHIELDGKRVETLEVSID